MRFATVSSAGSTLTVVVDADGSARVVQPGDVATLLEEPDWRERADAATVGIDLDAVTLLPVIPRPEKIICVGLNYRSHIEEMGREAADPPDVVRQVLALADRAERRDRAPRRRRRRSTTRRNWP